MHASHTQRGLGALFAAVLVAVALFSVTAATQTPSAHAATHHAVSSSAARGVDTSEAALRGAARRFTKAHGHARAHAAGAFPFSFGFNWGGAVLSIERPAGCSAYYGYSDVANALAATFLIPFPWNVLAIAAVSNFRRDIGVYMGAQGVDISFNWWGSVTSVQPRGGYQPC